jgi:hypothetical protein
LGFKIFFESIDASGNLVLGFLKLNISYIVIFLCLSEIEFELSSFTLALDTHILFPVLDALGKPFLHETSISLELVDLDSAHLLLFVSVHLHVVCVELGGLSGLSNELVVVLLLVSLKIDIFLGTVKFSKPLLEESVGHFIVLWFGHRDSLGGLVVAKSTGLGHD